MRSNDEEALSNLMATVTEAVAADNERDFTRALELYEKADDK